MQRTRFLASGTLVAAAALLAPPALAAPPDTSWTNLVALPGWQEGHAIAEAADGGVFVGGYSQNAGDTDALLVRADAGGDTLWTRTYGGPGWEDCRALVVLPDGGVAMAGQTKSSGAGESDVYVVRANAGGAVEWEKTWGGAAHDDGQWIETLPDGGFAIAGETKSSGAGGSDFLLVRTDSTGATLWEATYGGAGDEDCQWGHATADGGFVLTGSTTSYGAGGVDAYLVKTDAGGLTEWEATYGGADRDLTFSVREVSGGGFVVAGQTRSAVAGDDQFWVFRTDAWGAMLWESTVGGTQADAASSVLPEPGGGFFAAGVATTGADGLESYLVAMDASGDTTGTLAFHSAPGWNTWDIAFGLGAASDGGYWVTGQTGLFPVFDLYIARVAGDGAVTAGESVVAGATVRAAPNPFRESTTISFRASLPGEAATVSLFDTTGRLVRTLRAGAGAPSVAWDGRDASGRSVAAGVYWCRVDAPTGRVSGRIVRVK